MERTSALDRELAVARATAERQAAENKALGEAKATLDATLVSERRNAEDNLRRLTEAGEIMKAQFQALAASALQNNNASFVELAKQSFSLYQAQAKGELDLKEQAVKNMVDPIATSLARMNDQIQALEKERNKAYGVLTTQVGDLTETQRALQRETENLVRALRDPQTRGRWGELQLHKVLELSGMLEYCDFQEQVTASDEDRRYRPDVIVQLPGGKHVVVDSKAPLSWYLNSLEAKDEEERHVCLEKHARQIRQHIELLAAKSYWEQFRPTPEFVVLFIPGEAFFRAAFIADPSLLEYGSEKVILASPITLIAMLKTIAYGWNQKNLADSARNISAAGRDLYKRLCTMTAHMQEMGKKLGGTVNAYNEMLRSIESRVFPSARKFPEIDRSLAVMGLPDLDQVDKAPFELQAPDWQEEVEKSASELGSEQADSAKV